MFAIFRKIFIVRKLEKMRPVFLQVFNGYLNEIYQNSSLGNGQLKPVNVTFAIPQTKGSDQLENVLIELIGADPDRIVR